MKGEVDFDENKIQFVGNEVASGLVTLNVTTIAMIVWAAVVTLALAAMVVLVFRRLRKSPSSAGKVDAESNVGSASDISSEKSSVIDLNDAQQIARDGAINECFESDSVQVDYKHGEVDFDTVEGLYDDGNYGDNTSHVADVHSGEEEVAPSFSRAITKGQGGNSHNLRGLFIPDSKSTF